MASDQVKRKLAAILAADVAGYSRLMGADEADTLHLPLPGDPAACSMGNPHVTFFVGNPDLVEQHGRRWEQDPLFPEGVNVGYARVEGRDRMRLRVWERGAGLTLACGSGACAAVVNAHRRGLTGRQVAVAMDGGVLDIEYRRDGRVLMTGPVATSFRGVVEL